MQQAKKRWKRERYSVVIVKQCLTNAVGGFMLGVRLDDHPGGLGADLFVDISVSSSAIPAYLGGLTYELDILSGGLSDRFTSTVSTEFTATAGGGGLVFDTETSNFRGVSLNYGRAYINAGSDITVNAYSIRSMFGGD